MQSSESYSETLRWVVRARWVVLLMASILVLSVETISSANGVNIYAWIVILLASCMNLVYGLLASLKKITHYILPVSFLLDGALISIWVVYSGGAVSVNITYYLIILIAASLVHSPRMMLGLGLGIVSMFLIAMQVSYGLHVSAQVPAQAMNPFWSILDSSPDEMRKIVYLQQTLRWAIWMSIVTIICTLLIQRLSAREEQIREKERLLEQQRRLLQLGELAGRLAHNLNTPLGLISGNLEMLINRTAKKTVLHKDLTQLMGYVQRAVTTVESVLNYNKQNLSQICEVGLPDVVRAVAEATAGRLERKSGKIILDIKPDVPKIMAYPEAVYQAILNLVENAVDSLPDEGGTVALEARFDLQNIRLSAADQRGDVRIIVRDNGKGIPSAQLKYIFEPFYSTKDFGHGTGLGLSIVKRIMEEHHGQVKAERNSEGGMKFVLVFPSDGPPPDAPDGLPSDFFDR